MMKILQSLALAGALLSASVSADLYSTTSVPNYTDYLVQNLPGLPNGVNFDQYAGRVTVNETYERNLFFWLVESQNDPKNDPLIVWLNGGPGASSIWGMFSENGPFRPLPPNVNNEVELELNPFAWNKNASVLSIESPFFVGFSQSNDSKDISTDDDTVAHYNYVFLQRFFQIFDQFQSNDFYLTGESFAGHYIPTLAVKIVEGEAHSDAVPINFKGFAIGDPCTDNDWYYQKNGWSWLTYLWSHALLSNEKYTRAYFACGWDTILSDNGACATNFTDLSSDCSAALYDAAAGLPSFAFLNPFDVLQQTCPTEKEIQHYNGDNSDDEVFSMRSSRTHKSEESGRRDSGRRMGHMLGSGSGSGSGEIFAVPAAEVDPCIGNYTTTYLNEPDVQAAINIEPYMTWESVNPAILDHYLTDHVSVVPVYDTLYSIAPNLHIMIYSGTADSAVPFLGTQRWINCLNRTTVQEETYWYYESGTNYKQLAGTYSSNDQLTFVTVKGCSHLVPNSCPNQAKTILDNFFAGIF